MQQFQQRAPARTKKTIGPNVPGTNRYQSFLKQGRICTPHDAISSLFEYQYRLTRSNCWKQGSNGRAWARKDHSSLPGRGRGATCPMSVLDAGHRVTDVLGRLLLLLRLC